jgi:hypothetical protein
MRVQSLGVQGKHYSSRFNGKIAGACLVAAGVALMGYQCRKDVRRSSSVDGGQYTTNCPICPEYT